MSTTYRLRLERERAMRVAAEASCSAHDACTRAGDAVISGDKIINRARCPCQHAIYCDTGCQKAAWPSHKDFCKEKRKELLEIAAYEEEDRRKKILAADAAAASLLREEGDDSDDQMWEAWAKRIIILDKQQVDYVGMYWLFLFFFLIFTSTTFTSTT